MTATDTLPIEPLLPEICETLGHSGRLVLAAPPGAGKTSRVPLALAGLIEGFQPIAGRILLLEPRRLAARLAAERMAQTLGERVGARIGLSTRIERKVSKDTLVEVITDGLFVRRLLSDPGLEGVGAVIFDEIHERGLNSDLGLALAREVQSALREDLKLLAMSATLDTAAMSAKLAAPIIESDGRQYPVETVYLGRSEARIEDQAAKAVHRALRETEGSLLVFLPGAGEIRRTAERLEDLPAGVSVHPLYGALSPQEQDAAVSPAPEGCRKIVLSSDIAESALTIEGVSTVVDCGLARTPQYDPSGGAAKLVTVRVSRASADQRRGRAGRLGPGTCYRLWDEAETRGLTPAPVPEILEADLSGLVLSLAEWGERDPARLDWLDTPPPGRIAAAKSLLASLGALDETGALTDKGRNMAALPLAPRLAGLVASAEGGERALAAEIAALASEAGIGGASPDLSHRLARFRTEKSARARALQGQAKRWGGSAQPKGDPGAILAKAWPDRIARARRDAPGQYLLASGRAAHLPGDSALAKQDWLVVADMVGSASGARITLAASIDEATALAAGDLEERTHAEFDRERQAFRARRVKHLGAITLSESPLPAPKGEAARDAFLAVVRDQGFAPFGLDEAVERFLARLSLIRANGYEDWPELTLESLRAGAADWLGPALPAKGFSIPAPGQIMDALKAELGWPEAGDLDTLAPAHITLPSGREARIDYLGANAPLIEARVQELYGLGEHPAIISGRVALTLQLLSPARRPVAVTRDLPGFWAGGYLDMAKDMRGRYPKHDWPENPAEARPHAGLTKKRLA